MAMSKSMQERVQAFVAALVAEEGAGADERMDEIEDAMVELGDAVAQQFAQQKLAASVASTATPCCPKCGQAGQHVAERQRRLITRRGPVPLTEAKYRCRVCRRHFFPSVGSFRD